MSVILSIGGEGGVWLPSKHHRLHDQGGLHPGGLGRHPLEIHGILQDTVNKRAVCILRECILVTYFLAYQLFKLALLFHIERVLISTTTLFLLPNCWMKVSHSGKWRGLFCSHGWFLLEVVSVNNWLTHGIVTIQFIYYVTFDWKYEGYSILIVCYVIPQNLLSSL